jgi:hypothetical protein
MCFGSSNPQQQKIPPPKPATSFDYQAGQRSMQQQQAATMAAETTAPATSFGAELSGSTPMPTGA